MELVTDPAIIVDNVTNYGCKNGTKPSSEEYTSVAVQTMLLDYLRCVFCLFTLPATFIWYSYYFQDTNTSDNYHPATGSAFHIHSYLSNLDKKLGN